MSNIQTNELLSQIEQLVQSQTFTAAALDGIQAIKRKLELTLAELDGAQRNAKTLTDRCNALTTDNEVKSKRISELIAEIQSMKDVAAKGQKAIYLAEKHEAVACAWKEAMQTVFKPNAVRESVQRNHTVVMPSPNGAGYTQSVQNQDNILREDA